MNDGEKQAKKFLEYEGYKDIIYEPDGNIPPDFLVNREIAVEVRRLNQHVRRSGINEHEPLEDLYFRLIPRIRSLLHNFPINTAKISSFLAIHFRRPLIVNNDLITQIEDELNKHLQNLESVTSFRINNNLKIELVPGSERYDQPYLIGMISDGNSGGFVMNLLSENLAVVINEKENKISNLYSNYPEWWLILIDHIAYGHLSMNDLEPFRLTFPGSNSFTRIVLVSPIDEKISTIITPSSP